MSHEVVLTALPDTKEDARSLKEIAEAIGLATSTYTDWIRAERSLARVLRILIKWGWVTRNRKQRVDGCKFWHNVYWKTELAIREEMAARRC